VYSWLGGPGSESPSEAILVVPFLFLSHTHTHTHTALSQNRNRHFEASKMVSICLYAFRESASEFLLSTGKLKPSLRLGGLQGADQASFYFRHGNWNTFKLFSIYPGFNSRQHSVHTHTHTHTHTQTHTCTNTRMHTHRHAGESVARNDWNDRIFQHNLDYFFLDKG